MIVKLVFKIFKFQDGKDNNISILLTFPLNNWVNLQQEQQNRNPLRTKLTSNNLWNLKCNNIKYLAICNSVSAQNCFDNIS